MKHFNTTYTTKGYFQLLGSEVFSHHCFESNIHKGSQELIPHLPSHTNIQENSHTWTNFNATKGSFQLLGSEMFSHHRFESNIHKGSQELIPDLPSHTNMHENPHRWKHLTQHTQPKALSTIEVWSVFPSLSGSKHPLRDKMHTVMKNKLGLLRGKAPLACWGRGLKWLNPIRPILF